MKPLVKIVSGFALLGATYAVCSVGGQRAGELIGEGIVDIILNIGK